MRRPARARRRCRRCPFCAPSGRCLERTIKSGRCGDWVWYVRGGKQCRRSYARPRDPATLAQLRSRGRFSAASRKYSYWLTDEQRDACIAAGAKLRSRPRLGQSGPLTGQQYEVHRESAQPKAQSKATKAESAPQVSQPRKVTQSTWEPRLSASGVAPDHRPLEAGDARKGRKGRQKPAERRRKEQDEERSLEVRQIQRLTRVAGKRCRSHPLTRRFGAVARPSRNAVAQPGQVWYTPCVTSNTITIRLRRPKAEIEAKAKPNLNAWVNRLIEQALGPRSADWNEHFDRPSSGRKFRYTSQVKRAER